MSFELKCPNCGYPNLFLVVTETIEMNYRLSADGTWKCTPVKDAYGKADVHDVPKVIDSRSVLLCQCCGQENEAVLDTKSSLSGHYTMGREINHGAHFIVEENGCVIFD